MGKGLHLLCHRGHHGGGAVADGRHRDAGTEIDQRVAVDVHDDAAAGRLDVHGKRCADAAGDGGCLPGVQFLRTRARDGRHETTRLFDGRNAECRGGQRVLLRL
jgi:hypothetical protein